MPQFRPVMRGEKFEDIPLHGRPEFAGGILESDQPRTEDDMDEETKDIKSTPTSERKDGPVVTGSTPPCTDPQCLYAGSWHVHESEGTRGAGRTSHP